MVLGRVVSAFFERDSSSSDDNCPMVLGMAVSALFDNHSFFIERKTGFIILVSAGLRIASRSPSVKPQLARFNTVASC
jgi:hypothetical protein